MRSQMAAHMGVWQAPQLITIRHARYSNRRCRQCPLPRIQRDKWIVRANPREYVGSDGRRKSTIEEAFTVTDGGSDKTSSLDGRPPPWGIGWQTAEADLTWNDDVKKRLIKRIAADKLDISEEEFSTKLLKLQQLLPNLGQKLGVMKPDIIVQLAADPDSLAMKLIRLKEIFPEADTAQMVCSQLSLVLNTELQAIAASAEELRAILPNVNVDRLVQDNPGVLDVTSFKKTIEHAKQVMGPDLDVIDTLKRRPAMLFQFQQGKDLIAYDEVPTQSGQP